MSLTYKLIDVNGSFARFVKNAPKQVKKRAYEATDKSRQALANRMRDRAPVGPDAPHVRDAIEVKGTMVGVFDPEQVPVALYNEYRPNRQPFMRPAAMDEDRPTTNRVAQAMKLVERDLET
jgi:hypothetical protein